LGEHLALDCSGAGRAASGVAERRDLSVGWLNDAVKGFLVGNDPAARSPFLLGFIIYW